jgi:predicted hydrocarbon binding protein
MKVLFNLDQNIITLNGVMVSLHCHHYNCGLVKALEEMPGVNTREIFVQAAKEEFYINFSDYIASHLTDRSARDKINAAIDLYRFMGFGRLDLSKVDENGGLAYADSSYYVTGWLAKYGRRETPVCYLTCGFISGILEAIFDQKKGKYIVEETQCMITGRDLCEFNISVIT